MAACWRGVLRPCLKGTSGNAIIEFAFVAPVFLLFVIGIISYGGYFWLAHNLQQLANDSARAALAGLTTQERESLAQSALFGEVTSYGALKPEKLQLNFVSASEEYKVSLSYDASGSSFWVAAGLIPMPSPTIVRSASIRLGGY